MNTEGKLLPGLRFVSRLGSPSTEPPSSARSSKPAAPKTIKLVLKQKTLAISNTGGHERKLLRFARVAALPQLRANLYDARHVYIRIVDMTIFSDVSGCGGILLASFGVIHNYEPSQCGFTRTQTSNIYWPRSLPLKLQHMDTSYIKPNLWI